MKKNIAVFFGGDSPERDISIITGVQAIASIDKSRYRVYPILVGRGGLFYGDELGRISTYKKADFKKTSAVFAGKDLYIKKGFGYRFSASIDCALLCTHGGSGENGGLQGYLEVTGIPYTSPAVKQSAVCMDKLLAKRVFSEMRLKQVPFVSIHKSELLSQAEKCLELIEKKLPYPVIVKPASLGSSIGIKTADGREELLTALEVAAEFDNEIVIEKQLKDFTEVNCAALKKGDKILISSIEKPVGWQEYLTFDDKYTGGGKMSGLSRELPAEIPDGHAEKVRAMTEKIYKSLGLSGAVRMDFMIDGNGNVFINEVNTIPGSLAFYLFEDIGISYESMLSIVIENAIAEFKEAQGLKKYYASDVLLKYDPNGVGGLKK